MPSARGPRRHGLHPPGWCDVARLRALDRDGSRPSAKPGPALAGDVLEFAAALGIWSLGAGQVATRQGLVRATLGRDSALLDLEPLAGRKIALADVERDDWDAPGLARSLGASAWAQQTRTSFTAVRVGALRRGAERRISAYDFASLHDHPERATWLGGLLREASAGFDAWLLGSWLGLEPGVPERVREVVDLPLGEVTSPLGGPVGARFDAASRRLLAETGAKQRDERVTRVARGDECWSLSANDENDERRLLEFSAVVLAVGGVAAGGIVLDTDPESGRNGFRLGVAAEARLSLDGDASDQTSSLYGPDFEATGFGPLERVGVELTSEGWVRSDAGARSGVRRCGRLRCRAAADPARGGQFRLCRGEDRHTSFHDAIRR